jgi:peroxiredoxin
MLARKLVGGVALTAWAIVIAGCGQSAPQGAQATSDRQPPVAAAEQRQEPIDSRDVQPASDEAPAEHIDTQVKPAVATAPAEKVAALDPDAPAPLPAGASAPLPVDFGGRLPLEEAVDSGQAMPQVVLTEDHAKTCLVRVGDAFPKLELPNLQGQPQEFGNLVGDKLTIVVFWNAMLPTAIEELSDLQSRFLAEFGGSGVAVVGVNVQDDPKLAAELAAQTGARFPQLSDRDGTAFARLATRKLPRTYLIDASGKILWFDLEYSRTTRQQLLSALRFALKGP